MTLYTAVYFHVQQSSVHCGQGGWMGVIVCLLLMSTTATMGGQDNRNIILYMFDTYVKDVDTTLLYFLKTHSW